jgi:hypothetical protein
VSLDRFERWLFSASALKQLVGAAALTGALALVLYALGQGAGNQELRHVLAWALNVSGALSGFCLGSAALLFLSGRGTASIRQVSADIESTQGTLEEILRKLEAAGTASLATSIEEKRNKFLAAQVGMLHYANKDQIRELYGDYFREPTVKSLVHEASEEGHGKIGVGLARVAAAEAGGGAARRTTTQLVLLC